MTSDWKSVEKLALKVAWKFLRGLQARGVSIDLNDLMSDAGLTFVKAQNAFDPQRGVKFSTYFVAALNTNFARLCGRLAYNARWEISIDAERGSEGGVSLLDMLPSTMTTAEDAREAQERAEKNLNALSPLSRAVVLSLFDPGPQMTAEAHRLRSFSKLASQSGFTGHSHDLSLTSICRAIGLTTTHRKSVLGEIKNAAEK
jgi:DNA-directed RNA polymerase specialized sigma24 family protein